MKATLFVTVALAALAGALLPAPAPAADVASVYDTLALMKEHSVLYVAATEAKEATALRSQGPYTLLAPTDAAFKKLDEATIKKIATDKEFVRKLLRTHLIDGKLMASDLRASDGKDVRTLQGGALKVENIKDALRVGGAKVVVADVACSNGVIHEIDTVLPLAKE